MLLQLARVALLCLIPSILCAQSVQIPYNGQTPYSGTMGVAVKVTGLPTGCTAGAPVYGNATITVPLNCGVIPPPIGTNCQSASVPVTGCTIGSTVAVVNNPGNVRGAPAPDGSNGPLMGTQPGGAKGVIVTNPIPQATAGKGWQVVNFGTGTCNAAGPYSPTCGYLGNDNLAPSGVTPPPITTCAKTLAPSGGQDNAALLAAIAATSGGCVELTAGTFNLSAFTPPQGTSLVLDDAVVIQDFGIFGRTTPFFSVGNNNVSVAGAGPLFSAVVTMPTNYANAKKQVANGQDYEYQHCFALTGGVSGVVLSNFSLLNCAGDGVDLVNTSGAKITNVNSATNIRQGMSCTGPATNVTITGGLLHDGPLSGWDCEPDAGINGNIQIVVSGLKTQNNKGGGRSYGLMNLLPPTTVNIVDTGGVSTNDGGSGFAFWNRNSGTNANATGTLTFQNFTITGSASYCMGGNKSTDGYNVVATNGTLSNCGTSGLHLAVAGGETGSPGGVAWSGITINGNAPALTFASNTKQTTVTNSTYNGASLTYP